MQMKFIPIPRKWTHAYKVLVFIELIISFCLSQKKTLLKPLFMFQVSSKDQLLKVQEQLGSELQKQIETLSENVKEHKKTNERKSEELKQLEEELKDLQSQTEEKEKQLREADAQILSLEKLEAEMLSSIQETKKEAEVNLCTCVV